MRGGKDAKRSGPGREDVVRSARVLNRGSRSLQRGDSRGGGGRGPIEEKKRGRGATAKV